MSRSGRFLLIVGGLTFIVVMVGAAGLYIVEPASNPTISNFGDAVWLAIVSVSTVGYGDVHPTTTAGRAIAAGIIIFGMGLLGSLAHFLSNRIVADPAMEQMEAKVAHIEELLEEQRDSYTSGE